MLNLKLPITISIPAPAGVKTVTVRFPEDDHMERRQRARSFVSKSGGGRVEETLNECPDLDAEIVSEIRIDGDDLDQAECTFLLNKLSDFHVTNGGRIENGFFIEASFLGQECRHELRTPDFGPLQEYRRKVTTFVPGKYGITTSTIHLKPGRKLYDELFVKAEGYPDGYIPIGHKASVIAELSNLIDSAVQVSNPQKNQG